MVEGFEGAKHEMRQPIIAVLGHVDHGKTTLLDKIRSMDTSVKSDVVARESGSITQHVGATEIPAHALNQARNKLLEFAKREQKEFQSRGIVFIDTPGHDAFTTIRTRGGNLANLAILIIDIADGIKPQTVECIELLHELEKDYVIVLSKIDRIHGWTTEENRSFIESLQSQKPHAHEEFMKKIYELQGKFAEFGKNVYLYHENSNPKEDVSMVPISAIDGEGLDDLLFVIMEMSERFLAKDLTSTRAACEATIIEVKKEKGLGDTLDVLLTNGTLRQGEEFLFVNENEGYSESKIRNILRPKPFFEMKSAGNQWESVSDVQAAAAIKLIGPNFSGAVTGLPLLLKRDLQDKEFAKRWLAIVDEYQGRKLTGRCEQCDELLYISDFDAHKETEDCRNANISPKGILVKADSTGGIEALVNELKKENIPVRYSGTGPLLKREINDIIHQQEDQLFRAVLCFNVKINPLAEELAQKHHIEIFQHDIVYALKDRFLEWREEQYSILNKEKDKELMLPGEFLFLADHTFNKKSPAIIGVRILNGKIQVGQRILNTEGNSIGLVQSIRLKGEAAFSAKKGDEVAIGIKGGNVDRNLHPEHTYLADIDSKHASTLRKRKLAIDVQEILEKLQQLHRKDDHYWGR